MGGAVSSSIGNNYGKKIWVKYNVEKKYVTMENYEVTGQIEFAGISAGASGAVSQKYDWNKVRIHFTPIKPGDFKEIDIESKTSEVVYITIVADDSEILCQTWSMNIGRSLVITEEGGLRESGHKPLQVHRRYESADYCCSKLPFVFSTKTAKISPTSDVTKR